jgi:hypothetical protein
LGLYDKALRNRSVLWSGCATFGHFYVLASRPPMKWRQRGCDSECPFRSCLDTGQLSVKPQARQCSSDSAWSWACSGLHCKPSHLRTSHPLPHAASTQRWPRKITLVEFLGMSTAWKRRPGRPKWGWFCLDLRMRHPLSVFYTGVATPANAGTWVLGKNLVCFCRARIFPTWQLSRCGNFCWGSRKVIVGHVHTKIGEVLIIAQPSRGSFPKG